MLFLIIFLMRGSETPLHIDRTPCIAGAECGENHIVATLDAIFIFIETQANPRAS